MDLETALTFTHGHFNQFVFAVQVSLLPLWKHWMQRARGEIQDFTDWILSGSADQISMQKVEVLGSSTERKGLSCVRESSINC